jgi:hypothetical protein
LIETGQYPETNLGSKYEEIDYTQYPSFLDRGYEQYDLVGVLSSTIIMSENSWIRTCKNALLDPPGNILELQNTTAGSD